MPDENEEEKSFDIVVTRSKKINITFTLHLHSSRLFSCENPLKMSALVREPDNRKDAYSNISYLLYCSALY